jgi:hypothetical protein
MSNSLTATYSKIFVVIWALKQPLPRFNTPIQLGGRTSKHTHIYINQEMPRRPNEGKMARRVVEDRLESQHRRF